MLEHMAARPLVVHMLSVQVGMRWLSHVAFGVAILPLLTMHLIGLRACAVMRLATNPQAMTGRLVQASWASMRITALEQAAFAGLYLGLAFMAAAACFAGGAHVRRPGAGLLAQGGIPSPKAEVRQESGAE